LRFTLWWRIFQLAWRPCVPIDELLEKDQRVINKANLRRWFEHLPFDTVATFSKLPDFLLYV